MTKAQRWTLLAAILGSSIVFLDGTLVKLALPRIGRELPAMPSSALEGQTYVIAGYLATSPRSSCSPARSGTTTAGGGCSRSGWSGFGLTSVLCGLAPTLELLVVARLLQGAAGALLVPGSLAIITRAVRGPGARRGRSGFGRRRRRRRLIGPVVGGLLVDLGQLAGAFLINVPLVVIALFAIRHCPSRKAEDASGTSTGWAPSSRSSRSAGSPFGAIRGQDSAAGRTPRLGRWSIGAIALVAFPLLMARRPHPLVPLGLFRRRRSRRSTSRPC